MMGMNGWGWPEAEVHDDGDGRFFIGLSSQSPADNFLKPHKNRDNLVS